MADDEVYVIRLIPVQGREVTPELIHAHVEHLRALDDAGGLVMGGPLPGRHESLIVVRAVSLEDATAVAERDPFVQTGARTMDVASWLLATRDNGYLDLGE
jgi:uncharacterized protein